MLRMKCIFSSHPVTTNCTMSDTNITLCLFSYWWTTARTMTSCLERVQLQPRLPALQHMQQSSTCLCTLTACYPIKCHGLNTTFVWRAKFMVNGSVKITAGKLHMLANIASDGCQCYCCNRRHTRQCVHSATHRVVGQQFVHCAVTAASCSVTMIALAYIPYWTLASKTPATGQDCTWCQHG